MTWKQLTERDCSEWKLSAIDLHDRDSWRSGVRSAKRAASQLPRRGAHRCENCVPSKDSLPFMAMLPPTSVRTLWFSCHLIC